LILFTYILFFLSGAAALAYQVVWVRSLQLIFGGSHFAVTVVLAVFMAGLALGSHLFGKRSEAISDPLRLYGFLETGIAAFAVVFLLLMKVYPLYYVPLARIGEGNAFFLLFLRTLFAVAAMIVPTTLMGGTLPVLTLFASGKTGDSEERVSFLYGFNTLGAVTGTLLAGFFLLPDYGASATFWIAICTNAAIGASALVLSRRGSSGKKSRGSLRTGAKSRPSSADLILWGIGISGFCALGYEVFWTRVLSMVVGASVYSFTIMLVSFLSGIALGSKAFGYFNRAFPGASGTRERGMVFFGMVQVLIGLTALIVTYFIRDLPSHAIRIQNFLLGTGISEFEVRQGANFAVAFSHMFVPAFFMGVAFPLAGKIRADSGESSAEAIGAVSVYNTSGAILGAVVSGFGMIYLFGIERSLQLLVMMNVFAGVAIAVRAVWRPTAAWGVAAAGAALAVALVARPGFWRMWDLKYFAIYRNNTREAFSTDFSMKDAMQNTDVLYYAEGVQATVSSIRVKGGSQAFITNGRIEASNMKEGIQCQYTLGHLPMLLHKDPESVFVLGTGSGMTLGATSVHPEVKELVLAEIEPKVLGVARTFSRYNHNVLDNPKLKIVFNDGRNYLMTTSRKFDVITADPIHPWFSGAGYLYTAEYFRLAARRLRPGGIVCQWLPIYELSVDDLKCVVRTFTDSFRYSMLWLTRNDAELVGSNEPIVIDEKDLARRIAAPGVRDDLRSVDMGSADDFLSYFVMGTEGMRKFGAGGVLNTDDNLHLEFSAPMSMNVPTQGMNALALYGFREPLSPYVRPLKGAADRNAQIRKIERLYRAGREYAPVHVRFLQGGYAERDFLDAMARLERSFPGYAPLRFLEGEVRDLEAATPQLIRAERFLVADDAGRGTVLEVSAVKVRIGERRAAVVFVDNRTRTIFGQRYIDAEKGKLEERIRGYADDVLSDLRAAYAREAAASMKTGTRFPTHAAFLRTIKMRISERTGKR